LPVGVSMFILGMMIIGLGKAVTLLARIENQLKK
jgi:hypothetical protein